MRYAVLILALFPLICCSQCDQTWLCVLLSVIAAMALHVILSVIHELRLLAKMGQSARWSE